MAKIFINDPSVRIANRRSDEAYEADLTKQLREQFEELKSRWLWLEQRNYLRIEDYEIDAATEQTLAFLAEDVSPELNKLVIADGKLPEGWSVGGTAEQWVIDFLSDLLRVFGDAFEVVGSVEFSDQYGETLDTGWKARLDDKGLLEISWYGGDKEVW